MWPWSFKLDIIHENESEAFFTLANAFLAHGLVSRVSSPLAYGSGHPRFGATCLFDRSPMF
jgi:hypothetical protein